MKVIVLPGYIHFTVQVRTIFAYQEVHHVVIPVIVYQEVPVPMYMHNAAECLSIVHIQEKCVMIIQITAKDLGVFIRINDLV